MTDFNGKKIFVLGGSRGIGAAIVRRFAHDGGKVSFTYAGSTDAAKALAADTGAAAIQSDAADRGAVIDAVKEQGPSMCWWSMPVPSSSVIRLNSTPTRSTG